MIGLLGLGITIRQVLKSRTTAEEVQRAVQEVQSRLSLRSSVSDLARLVGHLDELQQLQAVGAWQILPQRYAAIRRELITIKRSDAVLTKKDKSVVQGIITEFSKLEDLVVAANQHHRLPDDPAALHRTV